MAKGMYLGVDGKARKVKKMYFGVGGVARKVKKAYIGVGGVARLFWSSGLAYYGALTPLQSSRSYLMATTVGNYAMFGGGQEYSTPSSKIDTYDKSLTHATLSNTWSYNGSGLSRGAAGTANGVAMFAGGLSSNSSTKGQKFGYGYDESLTNLGRFFLYQAGYDVAATTIGGYVLFDHTAADKYYTHYAVSESMTAVDSSLTTTKVARSKHYGGCGAATVGGVALFAGGTWYEEWSDDYSTGVTKGVDAFNSSLTLLSAADLDVTRHHPCGVCVGSYALFTGGKGTTMTAVAYNTSLTQTIVSSQANGTTCDNLKGATLGNNEFALVTGSGVNSKVYVFDASLTERTTEFNLSLGGNRNNNAATTLGSFAIFAGGGNTAEAITI